MITIFWSLLPIPLGIFCIFYGLLSERPAKEKNRRAVFKSKQDDKDLTGQPDPVFDDPEISYLSEKDILYYQILLVGLGFASIALGLDHFVPGLWLAAKFIIVATIISSLVLRHYWDKREEEALVKAMDQKSHEGCNEQKD